MSRKNRTAFSQLVLQVVLGLMALGALGLLIVGFLPFSVPALKKPLRAALVEAGVDSCSIGSIRVTALRGITVHNLHLQIKNDLTSQLDIFTRRLVIDYRLNKILRNWRTVSQLLPTLAHQLDSDRSLKLADVVALADSTVFPWFWRAQCHDARVCRIRSGSVDTLIDGCVAGYTRALTDELKLDLELDAAFAQFGSWQLLVPRVECQVRKEKMAIKKIEGKIAGGRLRGWLDINIPRNTITGGAVSLRRMELGLVHAMMAPHDSGSVSGRGEVTFDFKPSPLCQACLKGNGNLSMRDVRLRDIPLLRTLVLRFAIPGLNALSFRTLEGDFFLSQGQMVFENLTGRGSPLELIGSGWVESGGFFRFRTRGTFDASYESRVEPLVWGTMEEGDDGRRTFHCTISGTYNSPLVVVDPLHTRRAIRGVFHSIRNGVRSIFR